MFYSQNCIPKWFIKIGIAISCLISAISDSTAADTRGVPSFTKPVEVIENSDTLVTFSGKIVDSLSKESIPYATITFYKNDSSSMTIVSNEIGFFSISVNHFQSRIKISAIGYLDQFYYLTSDQNNLLLLKSSNSTLPDVIVSSKAKITGASRIIKKVNKRMEDNYGNFTFDQRFIIEWILRDYDSIKCKRLAVVGLRYNKEQRAMLSKIWTEDTINCDAAFLKFIGVPRITSGDIGSKGDILRREMVLGEKKIKSFDFRLLAHYQDKLYGPVYLVSFKPFGYTINDFYLNGSHLPLGYLKGEMVIKEDDYAVISIKYTWEMKVDAFNKQIEDDFHSSHWNADKVNKIIANPVIFNYHYSYMKDAVTGKYFLQTIKAESYESGYQIETRRFVKMNYQYLATSLGIIKIDD